MVETLPDRVRSKIVSDGDGCWFWVGSRNRKGYGNLRRDQADGGQVIAAHRYVYQKLVGPIPEGLQIDHLCRVRHCVNPKHLEPVEPVVNTRRSPVAPAAIRGRRTHCDKGHPFAGENLRWRNRRGIMSRICVECTLIQGREQGDRQRAAKGLPPLPPRVSKYPGQRKEYRPQKGRRIDDRRVEG